MRRAGPRSHARGMNTNTMNPQTPATHLSAALRRPVQGRMLAGVAAGLARYLGVDVTIVRIAFVVLTVAGGAGIPLYLAGLLLIPGEGSDQSPQYRSR
jgi:phage shock protein PspC (stress-responsive transcriptional regulator)